MSKKFQNSPVRLMITIIAKGKSGSVIKALQNQGINNFTMLFGTGTAKSEALDYFGLDGPEKEIIFTPIASECAGSVFDALSTESKLKKAGYGIAFCIPVSAISLKDAQKIKRPLTDIQKEQKAMDYELIAALADKNAEDEIMSAARGAGAAGGTIIRGRKAADGSEERFLNISIHAEKEIILIVTKSSEKKNIMKAMNDKAKSIGTDIMLLSLPVDSVYGL